MIAYMIAKPAKPYSKGEINKSIIHPERIINDKKKGEKCEKRK